MPFSQQGGSGGSSQAGFKIGYDQITANVTIASTTESAGTTVISAAAHTFDGALVRCEFFAPLIQTSTSASQLVVSLFESSTQIARLGFVQNAGAASSGNGVLFAFYFTPTAASHTYTVTAFSTVGTNGVISAGSGGTAGNAPAYVAFFKA